MICGPTFVRLFSCVDPSNDFLKIVRVRMKYSLDLQGTERVEIPPYLYIVRPLQCFYVLPIFNGLQLNINRRKKSCP